ncbi:hypothetical protein Ava_D0047 [Trichormus variabilis ATCC 29413]|uniref:Uncharacterized protein n=2 Tax=Anabaena variabilis TaxID=264691 RepID=Q3M2S4_TRIV2|nr:hypothetical protein [Trichormus variabilis]ABA24712.1 hypothetical protein Ava_D0047 [Trichormus variabilis ATCC 29413]MBC1217696.1 hypothetical protein [Trichormus variabilis ARAD]MBC1259026.1 hypothetical protein [Trichormus variabilis V5]MBC1301282.1 hypothetical protein [Trichormus variabilis N2B]MBC1324519.1 hypothetical protein [Trichormus variabilis 9RC]
MRLASSIRYGGQLIDAVDVDYDDYKRLGLICPECKSGVFLRQKSERAAAHFAHFKASDPALVKQCELRVSSYTKEELERKAREAKNQRLKLLQTWFWDIYFKHAFREGRTKQAIVENKSIERAKERYPIDGSCFWFRKLITADNVQEAIDNAILSINPEDLRSDRVRFLRENLVKSEIELHRLICGEIVDFLKVKRNLPLLQKVIAASFIMIEFSPTAQSQIIAGRWEVPLTNAVVVLCMIPWGEEFQSLDKKAHEQ